MSKFKEGDLKVKIIIKKWRKEIKTQRLKVLIVT